MNYSDYKIGQKEQILNEEFDSNQNGWPSDAKIVNGVLAITEKVKAFSNLVTDISLPVKVNQNKDFEIELSLSYDARQVPLIKWGDYWWQLLGSNFSFGIKHKLIKNLNFQTNNNSYNKFTIRKIKLNYYFFINEIYIYSTGTQSSISDPDLKIGFMGKGLNVDYLRISQLLPQNNNIELERTLSKTDGVILTPEIKEGGKYYSLIIGVSDYAEPKLNLDKPSKDAEKLKEILVKKYSFADSTTYLLINPTRQKIITELYRLRKVVGTNDNLLIFYAGHGYWDEDARQGYWWAKDAIPDDPSSWLSNSDLREQIRSIKSAHTLLISDACFSGGIFKTRGGNEIQNATKDIQLLYKMPSRRAMTSGTMTEVPDKSIFLEYLSKRLNDNKEKFLSSQQLFDSFRAAVINNSNVVPQDGVIAETGDEGGDFIFILKEN